MFLSSYRNTSGSLGEWGMLWEHEPQASVSTAFSSSPKLSRVSIETWRKCFLFLLENSPRKITKNKEHLIALFIIKMYILYTAQFTRHKLRHHLCVSTYRNMIINQSACIFSLSYFLNIYLYIYIYPRKGRWIVVKRRGIYPLLFTNPEGDSCFSIY